MESSQPVVQIIREKGNRPDTKKGTFSSNLYLLIKRKEQASVSLLPQKKKKQQKLQITLASESPLS